MWSGERLTKFEQPRDQKFCPECQKQINERKRSKRGCRDIFFIDPDDKVLKETIKSARQKLELPMEAAMPCKLKTYQYRETCGGSDNRKSKHACTVEAHESTEKRMKVTLLEGVPFVESLQSCAQVRSYAPSNEKSRCKSSGG